MKLLKIKLDKIITNPNQPRKYFDMEKLEELKESIKNNGLIQPIVVRKIEDTINRGKYEIIAGERRYRACSLLQMETIDALEIEAGNAKSYEFSILENIQRENLNAIEEAESYVMLMQVYKYNQENLAKKLGKTRASISNKIRLLKLPEEIKNMVKKGDISYGHARTLLSIENKEYMLKVAKKVVDKKYSVREVEKIARKYNDDIKNSTKLFKDENNQIQKDNNQIRNKAAQIYENEEKIFIENKLREFFETKVNIKGEIEKSGKIEIEFYDYNDLSRIMELLNIDFE